MKLNDWIKAARTGAGMTLEGLGERLGRTKGNVHGWEKGLHEPSLSQVLKIAEVTKADLSLIEGWPAPATAGSSWRKLAYDVVDEIEHEPARAWAAMFLQVVESRAQGLTDLQRNIPAPPDMAFFTRKPNTDHS